MASYFVLLMVIFSFLYCFVAMMSVDSVSVIMELHIAGCYTSIVIGVAWSLAILGYMTLGVRSSLLFGCFSRWMSYFPFWDVVDDSKDNQMGSHWYRDP